MNSQLIGSSTNVTGAVLVVVVVLAVIQLTLDVIALVDLYRRPVDRVALGNKWVWVAIILLVNLLGAILYLAVGRKASPVAEVPPPAPLGPRAGSIADSLYGPRTASPGQVPGQPPSQTPGPGRRAGDGPDEVTGPGARAAGPR